MRENRKMTVEELRHHFSQLTIINNSGNKWDKHRLAIRNHILKNEDPKEFIRWSTISATMHAGMSGERVKEYVHLLNDRTIGKQHIHASKDTGFGGSEAFSNDKQLGANYIHQAYKLFKIHKLLNIDVKDLSVIESIAEFGAGYGALCSVITNYGFTGRYLLYDFPELLLLQEYYLSNLECGVRAYYRRNFAGKQFADLMISILSLSEAPIETRNNFLSHMQAKYYFIQFQEKFFEVDNYKWFMNWARKSLADWRIEKAKMETHYYLFGRRTL